MEDERLTHAEAQICFFFISFFNLTTKLAFISLHSFSHQSFVNEVKIKDHMSYLHMNYLFDQPAQTCVCAELADTLEFLMCFEMLPKHVNLTPAQ